MADRDLRREGDENRVEGAVDDLKGRVKDGVGGFTGDSKLQTEGKIDKVKGKVKDTVGKVQQDIADEDREM